MELEREILAIPWSGKIALHANQSSVHGSKASLQATFVHSTPAWHVVCNVRPVCVRMCVDYVSGLCVWAMCVGYVCTCSGVNRLGKVAMRADPDSTVTQCCHHLLTTMVNISVTRGLHM